MIQLIGVRSFNGEYLKQTIELFLAPSVPREFFSHPVDTDFIELVNGGKERSLGRARVDQRSNSTEYVAMVDANRRGVDTQLAENGFDHENDFQFTYQRVRAHDIGVALIELAISSLLGAVRPPNRLHLVSSEGKRDLVPVHDHVPGEGNREVVAETFLGDIRCKRL